MARFGTSQWRRSKTFLSSRGKRAAKLAQGRRVRMRGPPYPPCDDARGDEIRLRDFDTLTFDVVGTLIDFETGILDWFRPTLGRHGVSKTDEEILTAFAAVEDKYQRESPEKPFPDTVEALEELGTRYRLVAVTNADAWALKHMSANMGDPFREKVTCDEVGVNKPSPRVFEYALDKLAPAGVEKQDILHTAQSQYHDIVPASALGFATMWIERRHGKGGFGATPRPQRIATPTFHAVSMADFVRQVREEQ